MRMNSTTFTEATAVTLTAPGRFDAFIEPGWSMGGRAHGGFLLALAARAGAAMVTQSHVVSASGSFVFAPEPGPVSIEAELLRGGRSLSQIHARVLQGGLICLDATIIVGELDGDSRPYWSSASVPPPGTGGWDQSVKLPPMNPFGTPVPLWGQVDLRIDRETYGYAEGKPTGAGELRGWLALPDGEDFDPISLLFALDLLPPATFDVERSTWVPTLTLSAYIRTLPAPGPVQLTQAAGFVENERVDEWCCAWDTAGRLVAQCTQLAGIRLG
jgi:hypothetical protein